MSGSLNETGNAASDNRHCIESAWLEISYSSEELALSQHAELEAFAKSQLLAIVSEVFDELASPDRVLWFERLELDLGELSLNYFYEDFSERLREQVRECLQQQIAAFAAGDETTLENHESLSRKDRELETLLVFLETGQLPWNAKLDSDTGLQHLMRSVIDESPAELLARIAGSPARNSMVARLSVQFDAPDLSRLLEICSDVPAGESSELLELILNLAKQNFGLGRNELGSQLWAELFQYALLDRSRRPGRQELLNQVLKTLGLRTPYRYAVLLERMLSTLQQQSRSQFARELVNDLAKELELELKRQGQAANKAGELGSAEAALFAEAESVEDRERQKRELRSKILTARARLIDALETGSPSRLLPSWQWLCAEQGDVVRDVVASLGQQRQVRHNIAWQFPEALIRDIVMLLEPNNSRFIEQLVSERTLVEKSEEELEVPEADARKSLWEFTLTYLLIERGSRFNRKSYIASVMTQLSAHANVALPELYLSLLSLLAPLASRDSLRGELLELLEELAAELGEAGYVPRQRSHRETAHQPEEAYLEPPESVVKAVALAFAGESLAELKSVWKRLLLQFTPWFVKQLRSEGQKASVRRNLAVSFSNPMFKETILVLEPVHGEFINETVHRSTTRVIAQGKRSQSPAKTVRTVREFSLSYLLVERGSRFNKKTYLHGLLRQMAARENVDLQSIVSTLRGSIQSVVHKSALHDDMLGLLDEITTELGLSAGSQSADARSRRSVGQAADGRIHSDEAATGQTRPDISLASSAPDEQTYRSASGGETEQLELIRAYLLFEKLQSAISSAERHGGSVSYHVVRLLHELSQHYPWMLHRFNQLVNAGQLSLESVIEHLPRALQERLLLSFMDSFAGRYRFNRSQFLTRLKTGEQALRVNAPARIGRRYYAVILKRLIGQQHSSLSELFEENAVHEALSLSPKKSPGPVPAGSVPEDSPPLSINQRTLDLIRAFLSGHLNLKDQDRGAVVSTLELLLSSQPATLAKLLKTALVEASASDRLVSVVPESLLVKLMLLLRPDDHGRAVLYADLITMAAVETEANSTAALSQRLHLAKWQFLFLYLIIEGRRFNEVGFVRQLAGYLAERSVARSLQSFRQELARSVRDSAVPSMHVPSVRIAMILGAGQPPAAESAIERPNESLNSRAVTNKSGDGHRFPVGLEDESSALLWMQDQQPAIAVEELIPRSLSEYPAAPSGFEDADDAAQLQRLLDTLHSPADADRESQTASTFSSRFDFFDEEKETRVLEDVYIDNAGLVILSPYLPRYFDMLGLIDGKKFKDPAAAQRAVHLLQYLVDQSTDSFEHKLVLNKLFCGVETGKPLIKSIDITEKEKQVSESLLQGVIANWPVLKNTSVAGLRESFLQREAHLQRNEDKWQLLVQSKAFDMLMDSIPWGYSTIKMAWMNHPIHVDWR